MLQHKDNPEIQKNRSVRTELYSFLYESRTDSENLFSILENIQFIYGYDITTLVFYFQKFKLNAKIVLINSEIPTEKNSITFQDGQIQFIELADADTRIGTLLVGQGLITKSQLEMALNNKGSLQLGAYLVQKKIITKEQIGSLMLSQSRSRLSKLITDQRFNLSITQGLIEIKSSELNIEQFNLLLHDWILSKFNYEWLSAHYLDFYDHLVIVNWNLFNITDLLKYSVLSLFNESLIDIIDQQGIDVLSVKFENNKNFFKAIHFLIILGWISLKKQNSPSNYDIKIRHIYKLIMNKSGTQLLSTLAQITKLNDNQIDEIHETLSEKFLGSEAINHEFKLEIEKKVINLLIQSQNKTYSLSLTPQLKNTNLIDQKNKKEMQPINTRPIKDLLLLQKFNEALALVKKYKTQSNNMSKIQLYSAWAHLGLAFFKNTQISINTLEHEFLNILPEDMNTADYHYVNYLLQKFKKLDGPALISLKKAIDLDSNIKNYPIEKSIFSWF